MVDAHGGGVGDPSHAHDVVSPQTTARTTTATATTTTTTTRAVMHVCDDRGRCLFHPRVTLRRKAMLGVMGGWKDVLPSCPECEAEDVATDGGPGGNNAATTRGGPPPSGGAVRRGGSSGGLDRSTVSSGRGRGDSDDDDDDDDEDDDSSSSSSSSSSSDDDSSSSGPSSASHSSYEEEDERGGGRRSSPRKKAKKALRRLNELASAASDKIQAAEIKKIAGAVGEKIRAEMRLAASDTRAMTTNDGDFVMSYISSGVPSSSRSSRNDRGMSSGANFSSSAAASSSRFRRPTPGERGPMHPPAVRQLDFPQRGAVAQRRGSASDGRALGPSSSSRREGRYTTTSELARRAVMPRGAGSGLRGESLNDYYDHRPDGGDDDDGMGRYGDGKMKKYFDSFRRSPPPSTAGESTIRVARGDVRYPPERRVHPPPPGQPQLPPLSRDGRREREQRPRRDAERTPHGSNGAVDEVRVKKQPQNRPRYDETERRPRAGKIAGGDRPRAPRGAGGDTSAAPKGGMKTRRGGAASADGGNDTSLRGAVPTLASLYGSDVAAYQWDRVPANEYSARHENGESPAAAADESASEEDLQGDILEAVAYQWDRMPSMPAGSSEEDPNSEGPGERPQISHDPDTRQQIRKRDDLERYNSVSLSAESEAKLSYEMDLQSEENFSRSMDFLPTRELWIHEESTHQKSKSWHNAESQQSIKDTVIPATSHAQGDRRDSDSSLKFTSLSKSAESKVNGSSASGLLSMEDLLLSITKDVVLSQKGIIHNRSGPPGMETSMPHLDCTGSSGSSPDYSSSFLEGKDSPENKTLPYPVRSGGSSNAKSASEVRFSSSTKDQENMKIRIRSDMTSSTTNLYEAEYGSDEESEEDGQEHQPKNGLDPVPAAPAPPPLSTERPDAPIPIAQRIGHVGGVKIDLSSLQASKPSGGRNFDLNNIDLSELMASKPSGGLNIDFSSLQASKPSKNPEANLDEIPQPEIPVIRHDIKTFRVDNLPFTGRFGESGMYTGLVSEQYEPHGKGTMVYDNGEVIKGYWNKGDLVRESELYSDSEEDPDEDGDDEGDDLSSSMANIGAKGSAAIFGRDRSRSRSRSKDRDAPGPPPPAPPLNAPSPTPSPLPPEYKVGDPGRHRDMIVDSDEASLIIEQLRFGDGA